MKDITPFLKQLLTLPGLSGYEDPVFDAIASKWEPLVDEIHRGRTGSLHALQRGSAPGERPSIMIATHMDAIGLMVTGIREGFIRLVNVGGVDPRVLPGTMVTIHATGGGKSQEIPAVIAKPNDSLLPDEHRGNPVPLEYLLADTGLPPSRVSRLVRVGDLVSFAQRPLELRGDALAGRYLDNRASVTALTICLEELRSRPHGWDVWAVATTQEEIGFIGAYGASYELHPAIAIAIDVTWAKGPGASDWQAVSMGSGPTLCQGPDIHPALFKAMKDLAEKKEIPHSMEYAPRHTGTDAHATQVRLTGIPSMVIGLPLRYMHTPVEVVSLKDIHRAGRLVAEFIAGLPLDFMEKITWDD